MNTRYAGDLPGRLRDPVVDIDPTPDVNNAEDDEKERGEHQRELNQRLASSPGGGVGMATVRTHGQGLAVIVCVPDVLEPPLFVTVSVTWYTPALFWFWR